MVAPQTFSFEGVVGGFKRFERVLGELSAAGEVVEGRFVDRFGNLQFASLEAIDLLYDRTDAGPRMLAATDPVNPYGAVLPWPAASAGRKGPQRVAAAKPTGDATIELAMTLAEVMAAADPPRLAGRRVALTEAYRNKVLSASGRRADSDVRKVHGMAHQCCIVQGFQYRFTTINGQYLIKKGFLIAVIG